MTPSTTTQYSAITQILHWTTAILVLVAFIYGPGGPEDRVYLSSRDGERMIHETLGVAVFAISLLRIVWRLLDTSPAPVPMARWMHISSKAVQGVLYVLLLLVPATAVLGAWFEGHTVVLLTGIQLTPPIAEAHALGATLAEVHGWLGDVILWVAGLHAAAAIYHHLVVKDGVLKSMLPFGASASRK